MRAAPWSLAALLAATAALACFVGPVRAPDPGRETTYWLAIESLAVDGDLTLAAEDSARFERRFGRAPTGALTTAGAAGKRLDAPWLWTRLASWARGALGTAGPFLLQSALFALAAALAWATLRPRLGGASAVGLVLLSLYASAAFAVPFRLEPRALELAAMAAAAAAIWGRRSGPARPADDLYRGSLSGRPGSWRWPLGGAAFGLVLAAGVAYAPLAWPLVAAPEPDRRGRQRLFFAVGAGLSLALLVAVAGAPWEPLEPLFGRALLGWAGLGLLVGRGVGLLPYFVPAIVLAAAAGRGEGRRFLLPAVALSLGAQVAVAPFDFVEGGISPGNAWFLPLLALLLAAAETLDDRRWMAAAAVAAAPWLAVPWLATVGLSGWSREIAPWAARLESWLPVPSTLRSIPGSVEIVRPGLRVAGLLPGVAESGRGALALTARTAELVVTSDRALSSLRLELGREAPSRVELVGGELGNTTFRPSGEVAVDVRLDARRARRHAVWWSRETAWTHALTLRLPAAPPAPVALDVVFGRPLVPGGETP